MKHSVLLLDRFADSGISALKAIPNVDFHLCNQISPTKEQLLTAHAILIRTKVKVDAAFLDSLPALKVIVTATSGFDHIDLVSARKRNVQVFFCPEGNQASAAEHTLTLALATARKVINAQKAIRTGVWDREPLLGRELSEKTWAILGLGRIGARVARLAQAFDMKVVAYDPFKSDEYFEKLDVERVGVIEAFTLADVLSLHVPLTKETRNIVKAATLEFMEPTALIINTSRGEAVQEQDLLKALSEGQIAGAGLDVFENEPLNKTSMFIPLPNVVLTPHIGANTVEAFNRSCLVAVQKTMDFLNGKTDIPGDPWQEEWFAAEQNAP